MRLAVNSDLFIYFFLSFFFALDKPNFFRADFFYFDGMCWNCDVLSRSDPHFRFLLRFFLRFFLSHLFLLKNRVPLLGDPIRRPGHNFLPLGLMEL